MMTQQSLAPTSDESLMVAISRFLAGWVRWSNNIKDNNLMNTKLQVYQSQKIHTLSHFYPTLIPQISHTDGVQNG
jgi:hypothetical protein